MREDEGANGLCPIADNSPGLCPENTIVVSIFNVAQPSAEQVEAEDKTYIYFRPSEIESLMRIYAVPKIEWPSVLDRVQVLQDIANNQRPRRPKPRASRK